MCLTERVHLVFCGTPEFAVPTLEALVLCHDVALVVTQPDRAAGRGMELHAPPVKLAPPPPPPPPARRPRPPHSRRPAREDQDQPRVPCPPRIHPPRRHHRCRLRP